MRDELSDARNALRQAALADRRAMRPDQREKASDQVARNLLALPLLQEARSVALYLALPEEVSTLPLITRLRERPSPPLLAAPVIRPGRRLAMYALPRDLADLERGAMGILQPPPAGQAPLPPDAFDVILVPGVAFDRSGHRLGFGAGYYDRYLASRNSREAGEPSGPAASPESAGPRLIGVCFSVQLRPAIPATAHDVPMDFVATEDAVLRCSRA